MTETLTRALSGLLYIIILISATLFLNSFLILFGILLLLSVSEFCVLMKINSIIAMLVAVTIYYLAAFYFQSELLTGVLLVIFVISAGLALLFLFDFKKGILKPTEKYFFLLGYVIIPFVLLAKLPYTSGGFNPKIIIALFILIWTNDTMAYAVGKSLGKNKLFERVSPKKTVEGFLGGLLFVILCSVILSKYYISQPVLHWIVIALIVGILGTIGDLIESKLKRIAGVKDSGRIMPGHGGILDRLDSIIFAGPFVFLFFQILNYVS